MCVCVCAGKRTHKNAFYLSLDGVNVQVFLLMRRVSFFSTILISSPVMVIFAVII